MSQANGPTKPGPSCTTHSAGAGGSTPCAAGCEELHEISIHDIVERANVGRSTFYAHYQDKDDLLRNGFNRALDILIQHVSFGEADQDFQLDATPLFLHAKGHYELYRTLVWGSGFEVPTMDGHAALSAKFQEFFTPLLSGKSAPPVPLDILSYSLAGTLLILLK